MVSMLVAEKDEKLAKRKVAQRVSKLENQLVDASVSIKVVL